MKPFDKTAKVAVAAAVNDHAVLNQCLAKSPDVVSGRAPLRIYERYSSASAAYNAAIDDSDAEIILLAHQDVYLPPGTIDRLLQILADLEARDPNWAVAGVVGIDGQRRVQGQAWASGLNGLVGVALQEPAPVEALDELLLIVRKSSGLRFDEALPGFHLYGVDIVQTAKAKGLTSYAIPLLAIHHSRPTVLLASDYKRSYRFTANKWRDRLPIPTLICTLSANPLVLLVRDLRIRKHYGFRTDRTEPKGDPVEIARQLALQATG